MKKPKPRKPELTSCGDTNEQGLIFWLGTKSKVKAWEKAAEIIRIIDQVQSGEYVLTRKKKTKLPTD